MKTVRIALLIALLGAILVSPNAFGLQTARAAQNSTCTLTWNLVSGPTFSNRLIDLRGVDGTVSDDVWAVGDVYKVSNLNPDLLILHWNGKEWSQVDAPDINNDHQSLYAVTAISPTDAWAVGYGLDSSGNFAIVLRWDGATWTNVALSALFATSLNDV